MYMIAKVSQYVAVASFAEAWIEILLREPYTLAPMSPPSRRRGLKFYFFPVDCAVVSVASFAEAWIEIDMLTYACIGILSPPSRRRGLKSPP